MELFAAVALVGLHVFGFGAEFIRSGSNQADGDAHVAIFGLVVLFGVLFVGTRACG